MTLHVLYLAAVPAVGGLIVGLYALAYAVRQARELPC